MAGASRLAALRCEFEGPTCVFRRLCGISGTGGASSALGTACDGAGEGARKVRSVMELELPRRSSWAPGGPLVPDTAELATEDTELALRIVLFVCTSATEVGDVGLDRRAAPAAAAASDAFEDRSFRKAWAAALVAFASALDPLRGYNLTSQPMFRS